MSEAIEDLLEAQEVVRVEYDEWKDEGIVWERLGYLNAKPHLEIPQLLKDNWKTITGVAAAAGLPIVAADSGAFSGVLGVLKMFIPFIYSLGKVLVI
jgi:hypothetical protein